MYLLFVLGTTYIGCQMVLFLLLYDPLWEIINGRNTAATYDTLMFRVNALNDSTFYCVERG